MNLLRLIPRAGTAAALLFAVGCGGGGGGPSQVTISEQNAAAIAGAGMGAVEMVEGMSEMTDGMSEMFGEGQQVMPCDSGNAILSIYDLGAPGLSTGDYASIDFNACNIGEITFNGGIYMRAEEISGDPLTGPFTREMYSSFNALTGTIFGAVMVIDGGITASISSADNETFTMSVDIGRFSAFAQGDGGVFSGTLNGYHCERTWNETTGAYSVEFVGSVMAAGLGGTAHFETTVPFTGTGGDHPSAGTFVATGANDATVTLIALDNVNVQILVDADADGVNETTINTTWDALQN